MLYKFRYFTKYDRRNRASYDTFKIAINNSFVSNCLNQTFIINLKLCFKCGK